MMEIKNLKESPINYYVSGIEQGECVLFLHAAFADHTMFDRQVEYFKDKYKIITVDLIGHGQSMDTKKGDSIDMMAEWIHQIIDQEQVEKVHLIGVSLGSLIVQDFANKYPERVASLACFGGYNINDFNPNMQKGNNKEQGLMMLRAIFSIKWFAEKNKKISAYTKEAQEEFYQMNIRFPKKSFLYLASLNGMVNKCITKERDYDLLIGCGEKDIPMELEIVKLWHNSEPASRVIIFEGSGHLVNMDVPQEFNQAIDQFLRDGF